MHGHPRFKKKKQIRRNFFTALRISTVAFCVMTPYNLVICLHFDCFYPQECMSAHSRNPKIPNMNKRSFHQIFVCLGFIQKFEVLWS